MVCRINFTKNLGAKCAWKAACYLCVHEAIEGEEHWGNLQSWKVGYVRVRPSWFCFPP